MACRPRLSLSCSSTQMFLPEEALERSKIYLNNSIYDRMEEVEIINSGLTEGTLTPLIKGEKLPGSKYLTYIVKLKNTNELAVLLQFNCLETPHLSGVKGYIFARQLPFHYEVDEEVFPVFYCFRFPKRIIRDRRFRGGFISD